MDWLTAAAQLAAVLGVFGGAFSYFVIAPLADNIKKLSELLDAMRSDFQKERQRREEMNQRLTVVEERSKSNTHRIDTLELRMYEARTAE